MSDLAQVALVLLPVVGSFLAGYLLGRGDERARRLAERCRERREGRNPPPAGAPPG